MVNIFIEFEKFLSDYPNIINFLVAIGTVGAVVSSLYFSKLSLKPKIKAFIYISQLWLPNDENTYQLQKNEDYISLTLNNKGIIPIYIPYYGGFSWFFKFHKTAWMQNILYPSTFNNNEYELQQYKSANFMLCKYSDFIQNIKKELIEKSKYPRFLLHFIRLKIRTSNNEVIVAKIDKKIIKRILSDVK